MKNQKSKKELPLHQFIATGGKPKDYVGTTATSETVPNFKGRKSNKK